MSTAAAEELCVKLNMEAPHPTIGNRECRVWGLSPFLSLSLARNKKNRIIESRILRGFEPCIMIPVFYFVCCEEWIAVDEAGTVLK